MLWGKGGLFMDLIPTVFFVTSGMVLGMTHMHRGRIMKGNAPVIGWHRSEHPVLRFVPSPLFIRALVLGIYALMVFIPLSTALVVLLMNFPISFNAMLVFKAFYGVLVALLVTPIIIIRALADKVEVSARKA